MKPTLNYKWIATGILIGYLSPYVIALLKSYFSPRPPEKAQEPTKETNPYGN